MGLVRYCAVLDRVLFARRIMFYKHCPNRLQVNLLVYSKYLNQKYDLSKRVQHAVATIDLAPLPRDDCKK